MIRQVSSSFPSRKSRSYGSLNENVTSALHFMIVGKLFGIVDQALQMPVRLCLMQQIRPKGITVLGVHHNTVAIVNGPCAQPI